MKGRGLVLCYFPYTAQRCNQVLAFTKKAWSKLITHCVLGVDSAFFVKANTCTCFTTRNIFCKTSFIKGSVTVADSKPFLSP